MALSTKKRTSLSLLVLLLGLGVVFYTQFTIFVVQPIGAVPEGRTLIISKLNGTKFIDSADAMCVRMQGGVSLFCRGMTMAAVAKSAKIYSRLPYSETLYLISTGGKTYQHQAKEDPQ
jgi:hypothetical protein